MMALIRCCREGQQGWYIFYQLANQNELSWDMKQDSNAALLCRHRWACRVNVRLLTSVTHLCRSAIRFKNIMQTLELGVMYAMLKSRYKSVLWKQLFTVHCVGAHIGENIPDLRKEVKGCWMISWGEKDLFLKSCGKKQWVLMKTIFSFFLFKYSRGYMDGMDIFWTYCICSLPIIT